MKKTIILMLFLCRLAIAQAQNINAAEYFFDTDPGLGNGTPLNIAAPGTTVNFSALVSTAALGNGFHFLGLRTRDEAGRWGLIEYRGLYISSVSGNASNIVAAEFFLDTDPGVGNGTALTVTAGPSPAFVAVISTAALQNGFHFLGIRVKDADGKWSLYENRGFYISSQTNNVSNITAAEYFIDNDPGVGNAVPVTVTAGPNPTFALTVPTTALGSGFHFLSIRTKDADGHWGLFENRGFYISSQTNNVSDIVAAEFFLDNDPGAGNGTPITINPGPNPVFVATIPAGALSPGFHFAAIRTRDADGNWGLFENRGFYISSQTSNVGNMIAAEYFIDTDPGVGNGTPFTIPNSASFNQPFVLNIPGGTSQGQHFVAIRVMNEQWGLFDFDTITVSGILPLRLLSFTGNRNAASVFLKWRTDNELNTSHFEIERSTNSVTFSKIGTVGSNNTGGVNNYQFEDASPAKGINFYRLKQVDIDGKFSYSNILRMMFDNPGRQLNIYPNPAANFVRFDFSGNQRQVIINLFDAQGKHVLTTSLQNQSPLQLNIERLPKGQYSIQLSDGETVESGSFIKQ